MLEGAEDPARDVEGGPEASLDDKAFAKRRLRRGVVNLVDVDIPLGMVIPKAKLALVSLADTQGAHAAARTRRRVDITEITFPYQPGDYVVHAAHGVAYFKELVRAATWTARRATTCCLSTRKATSCTCPWSSWTA